MGKKCTICKKKVGTGDIIKADDNKYFHIGCFICKACQAPLADTGYYCTPEGVYVCPTHYHGRSSVVPVGIPLSIKTEQPKRQQSQQLPSPPLGSPTACAACGDALQSGQVLLALNHSWHVWCFKCSECAAVLQGEYMAHEGQPLCLRDYNLKHGVKCYECEKFIAGRVLEAGGYKFHPTCARCSRCGNHFADGQEMYMQGNEIWHPKCEHYQTTENIAVAPPKSTASPEPKYQMQFGQYKTYLYMLPEAEQTTLKHPISPHPPQPMQFHMPLGPIKIRKSRLSTLKTGMQRLAEDLDKQQPRPKSPHMDNEEPIELAHYPPARVPGPEEVPAIEREDFPAPPYPYAVEEMKRRLSSSSIEDDEEEDAAAYRVLSMKKEAKAKKNMAALNVIDKDSSIAYVIKQNLEDSRKKTVLPLHWDPRNASRTPSAKKMPHLKFRYDTPINASPSRHMNRPKPWVFWQNGEGERAGTMNTLPNFHLPQSRGGTVVGGGTAATMPNGYQYWQPDFSTMSSRYSDHSLDGTTLHSQQGFRMSDMRAALRTSLPDMNKPVNTYPLEALVTTNKSDLPDDVDRQHRERHLAREEFEKIFDMTPIEFYKLPEWKRLNMKRKVKLF